MMHAVFIHFYSCLAFVKLNTLTLIGKNLVWKIEILGETSILVKLNDSVAFASPGLMSSDSTLALSLKSKKVLD